METYENKTFLFNSLRMQNIENKIDFNYQCALCNLILNDNQQAIDHSLIVHSTNQEIFHVVYAINSMQTPETNVIYQCLICNAFTNCKEILLLHLSNIHLVNSTYMVTTNPEIIVNSFNNNADINNETDKNILNNNQSTSISLLYLPENINMIQDINQQNIHVKIQENNNVEILQSEIPMINNTFNNEYNLMSNKQEINTYNGNQNTWTQSDETSNIGSIVPSFQLQENSNIFGCTSTQPNFTTPGIRNNEDNKNNNIKSTENQTNLFNIIQSITLQGSSCNIILDSKYVSNKMNATNSEESHNQFHKLQNKDATNKIERNLNQNVCEMTEEHNYNIQNVKNVIDLQLKCWLCNASFNNADTFKYHISEAHKNLKPGTYAFTSQMNITKLIDTESNDIKYSAFSQCRAKNRQLKSICNNNKNIVKVQTLSIDDKENIHFLPVENSMKTGNASSQIDINNESILKSCLLNKLDYIKYVDIGNKIRTENMNSNQSLRLKRKNEDLTNSNIAPISKKAKLNINLPHTSNIASDSSFQGSSIEDTLTPLKKKQKHRPKVNFMDSKNLIVSYKCFVCFRYLPTEHSLYKHINANHFKNKSLHLSNIKMRYECVYCFAHFLTKTKTINHIQISHKNRIKTNEIIIRPLLISPNRLLRCLLCKKTLQNFQQYKIHIKKHRNLNLYSCKECPKSLYNRIDFAIHSKNHLIAGKNLCAYCGFFYSRKGFEKHMLIHSNNNYSCDICDKIFITRNLLNHHLQTHYNVKYFKCGLCTEIFQTSFKLTYHIKMKHSRNCYPCFVCGLIFARRILLQKHKENHFHKIIYYKKIRDENYNY